MKKVTLSKIKLSLNKWDYLIYIFIFLIPLTHKEMFSIYDADLVLSKWVLSIIACVGFYYFIKYRKDFKKDIFYIFLSSVLFGQIFSVFVSLERADTFRLIAFQAAITFAYPFFRRYTDVNGFNRLFKVYLLSFFSVFAFLIWQIIYQQAFGKLTGGIWPVPGYPTRYGSTFWDVNHFGAYLSSMIFMFLGYYFSVKKYKYRNMFLGGAILALIALTFTDSRSASLGFIAGLALFFGFAFKERVHETVSLKNVYLKLFYNNAWVWTSLGLVLGSLGFIYIFQDLIHKAFFYRSTSFFSHLYLLKAGVNLAFQNFSSGIGANAFYAYFKQSDWASAYYYIDSAALNYKLPLHNLWLEVFVETGIISFVIFTLMWVVGIGLLVKLFRKKNDFIALGFAAGIVSFLVGGLFYSYKSEFFWIYVILAFVYGSKDLDDNVIVEKFKDAKYIFYYIFEDDRRFMRTVMVGMSILSVLTLTFYIFNPLEIPEVDMFYLKENISLLTDPFIYFINMLRYTLGNYSFTGRVIPLLFYIGTFILTIGIFKRYFKFYEAITIAAIMMSIMGIFAPPVIVAKIYLVIFPLSLLIYGVSRIPLFPKKTFHIDYRVLSISLIFFTVVANISVYQHLEAETYDKDASFILELAANRGVLSQATIWIDEPSHFPLIRYYSDHVTSSGAFTLKVQQENVRTLDQLNYINFAEKNVFVVSGLNKYLLENSINFSDIIKHRDYYILISEPETLAGLDSR